jgi:hypothetical protein
MTRKLQKNIKTRTKGKGLNFWGVTNLTISYFSIHLLTVFFLIVEGPRSRRYGRTAALRLIVQHCDEGDDYYYYFLSFS